MFRRGTGSLTSSAAIFVQRAIDRKIGPLPYNDDIMFHNILRLLVGNCLNKIAVSMPKAGIPDSQRAALCKFLKEESQRESKPKTVRSLA